MSGRGSLAKAASSLALVVALASATGACGSSSAKSGEAAKAKNASAKADGSAAGSSGGANGTAAASASGSAGASGGAVGTNGGAAGSTNAAAGGAVTTTTLDLSRFEGDFVDGGPHGRSLDDPRPANCDLAYGQMCRFQILGTYQLKSGAVASIEVGAYEDGATTPAFHTALPNAKKGSARWHIDSFPYMARDGVKEMTILVKLLDPNGKELARGTPTVFPVAKFNGK